MAFSWLVDFEPVRMVKTLGGAGTDRQLPARRPFSHRIAFRQADPARPLNFRE